MRVGDCKRKWEVDALLLKGKPLAEAENAGGWSGLVFEKETKEEKAPTPCMRAATKKSSSQRLLQANPNYQAPLDLLRSPLRSRTAVGQRLSRDFKQTFSKIEKTKTFVCGVKA